VSGGNASFGDLLWGADEGGEQGRHARTEIDTLGVYSANGRWSGGEFFVAPSRVPTKAWSFDGVVLA
jgi:hypothetical protein